MSLRPSWTTQGNPISRKEFNVHPQTWAVLLLSCYNLDVVAAIYRNKRQCSQSFRENKVKQRITRCFCESDEWFFCILKCNSLFIHFHLHSHICCACSGHSEWVNIHYVLNYFDYISPSFFLLCIALPLQSCLSPEVTITCNSQQCGLYYSMYFSRGDRCCPFYLMECFCQKNVVFGRRERL